MRLVAFQLCISGRGNELTTGKRAVERRDAGVARAFYVSNSSPLLILDEENRGK